MIDWRHEEIIEGGEPVCVQMWAPHALFARPEFRAERVSYPVMTPSAARGALNAIFGKPEFEWWPVAIEILSPIRQATFTRNEFNVTASPSSVLAGKRIERNDKTATQRSTLVLRDVAYRVYAQPIVSAYARRSVACTHPGNPHGLHPAKNAAAYRDQLRKRVRRGACFSQPYFGAREFTAFFGPADDTPVIEHTEDLGVMIHSTRPAWTNPHHPEQSSSKTTFEWFHARIENGVLRVPQYGDYTTEV